MAVRQLVLTVCCAAVLLRLFGSIKSQQLCVEKKGCGNLCWWALAQSRWATSKMHRCSFSVKLKSPQIHPNNEAGQQQCVVTKHEAICWRSQTKFHQQGLGHTEMFLAQILYFWVCTIICFKYKHLPPPPGSSHVVPLHVTVITARCHEVCTASENVKATLRKTLYLAVGQMIVSRQRCCS